MSGRIRSIKPEWLEDELLASASDEARVLSVALILAADDHGRGRAALGAIAAEAWRYQLEADDGKNTPAVLAKASRALGELVRIRFVSVYEVNRQRYFEIRNWKKHQRVDKPSKPKVPPPPVEESRALEAPSRDPRETLARNSGDPREDAARPSRDPRDGSGSGEEGKGGEGNAREPEIPSGGEQAESGEPRSMGPAKPFGFLEARDALNRARDAAGLGQIALMSRDETTALIGYAETVAARHADPAAHVQAAHAAWIETADNFEKDRGFKLWDWLKEPDKGLVRKRAAKPAANKPKRPAAPPAFGDITDPNSPPWPPR
jgi:hypothetical protein